MDIAKFVDNALKAADLLQGYCDIVLDKTEDFSDSERNAILAEVKSRNPAGADEAGAKAIIIFLLEDKKESCEKAVLYLASTKTTNTTTKAQEKAIEKAHLEAAEQKLIAKFATAFGTDGTCGDTSFHPQHFEASADDTFDTLMEKWRKIAAAEYFGDDSKPLPDKVIEEEGIETPEGFWVYDENTKIAVEASCDYDPGCDSALYAMIHGAKLIMERLGKKVEPE